MNNAELYTKNNALQKRDTVDCLEEFAMKINWKSYGARIIDIGCGDGSTTTEILKSFVPKNFSMLIGADLSERMVKFANDNYGGEQVMFTQLNIEERLPEDLKEGFDHVFSFFTLHWIKQQRLAFTNIYSLLAEGGTCLVLFLAHMPIFDVYRVLARHARWAAYLDDVDRFTSPYHDSQNPEEELKDLMTQIGFRDVDVRIQEKFFSYDNLDNMRKSLKAVTPFKIPEHLWEDYMEDYLEVVRNMQMMDVTNNNTKEPFLVTFNYKVLTAVASK